MKNNGITPADMRACDQDDTAFSLNPPRGKEEMIARMLDDPRQCYFGQETVRWLFNQFRSWRGEAEGAKAALITPPSPPVPAPVFGTSTLERLAAAVLEHQQAGAACFISIPPAEPKTDPLLDRVVAIMERYECSYSGRMESAEEALAELASVRDEYQARIGK